MKRVTVRIKDCDGEGYPDLFFIAPSVMNEKQAVRAVDKSICKVQKLYPTEYTYDDLKSVLSKLGFTPSIFAEANERW